MPFEQNDAPVLIVFGQSNAHGHGTRLPEALQIHTPLSHVHGLARRENQHYGLADVTWSGFTSAGMNLGESQDDTFCLATEFARRWQSEIDAGNFYNLPDLYVIQISIGSQGIDAHERDGLNMWWPERPRVMKPGNLDEVEISLYPLAEEILRLAMQNLVQAGKTPRILGLHWNQWETEVHTGGDVLARACENYSALFTGFRAALGTDYPLYLYRPLSERYEKPAELRAMDALLTGFAAADSRVHLFDLSKSLLYNEARADKGIFLPDFVHYTPAAHRLFAQWQFADILMAQ